MRPRPSTPSRGLWLISVFGVLGAATLAVAQGSPPGGPTVPGTVAPGQRLSLADAIELALRQHPSLRAAQEGRAAARARVPQAQAPYYPRFDWINSAGRSETFAVSVNRSFTSSALLTSVEARQLLFDFGRTSARVAEARAGLRVSEAGLERTREEVVLNVKDAYFGLLQARRLVRVAKASSERAELNLRSARGFFEVGTKPKSDVTRAEVEVANARVVLIRTRNAVRLAETALANSLGLEATTPIEVEDILRYEPVPLDPQALLLEGLGNRPELAGAQARLDAAAAQLAAARRNYFPELTAEGSYGGFSDDFPLRERWSVGVTMSWNLFEGGLTRNRIRESAALVEAARAEYDTLELQVRLEVEQAYIALVDAAERIGATEKAVESARENLRLAQGRYDAGVGTILDQTDAQLALTSAEADQVRALTDYNVGLAVLDRAVGRP